MLSKLFKAWRNKQQKPDVPIDNTTLQVNLDIGNAGIEIAAVPSFSASARLVPNASVDQTAPRDAYVYAHVDPAGKFFYIGRGSGRRAWSRDRDRLWHRYVDEHLQGKYTARILADGLLPSDAEALEGRWIDQENEGLINLQNMARRIDLDALRHRDELWARNKALIAEARTLEGTDRDKAIALYKEALSLLKQFAGTPIETGMYAKVLAEHVADNGPIGQISLLDRLTLCLVRAGRMDEARACAEDYFSFFKAERALGAAQRIAKRVAPGLMSESRRTVP
jgi:hypothetical protein